MAVVRVTGRPKPKARSLGATGTGWPFNRRPYKRPPVKRSTPPRPPVERSPACWWPHGRRPYKRNPPLPPVERGQASWWPHGRRPYKRNLPQAMKKSADVEIAVGGCVGSSDEEESVGENSYCSTLPAEEVSRFLTFSPVRCEISTWMDEEEADDDELLSTATSAKKEVVTWCHW